MELHRRLRAIAREPSALGLEDATLAIAPGGGRFNHTEPASGSWTTRVSRHRGAVLQRPDRQVAGPVRERRDAAIVLNKGPVRSQPPADPPHPTAGAGH